MVARRVIGGVIGAGIIVAVVVPVMLFVFGIGVDNISSQIQDPPLEIPFPIPDQPIDPNTPSIIEGNEGRVDIWDVHYGYQSGG